MNTLLAQIEADDQRAAVTVDLERVREWKRRPGLSFGRRAPGLWARLLCWWLG